MSRWHLVLALVLALAPADTTGQTTNDVPPPTPLLPVPTARQLEWQYDELRLFIHFGINTFTNREWGTGDEDPALFDPVALDPGQWARVARESGFRTAILTAKHHDGFTLWPSRYTDFSVQRSPWRDGRGDVVREFVDAIRSEGLRAGLYLSPWDMHEPSYGDEQAYNAFYMGQLRELLTGYGPLSEIWFDGAKGENARDMRYDFDAYWSLVRQLQPGAVMFSDAGPDVRWIGNEHGFASATNWSTYDRKKVGVGMHGIGEYLNQGEAGAPDWVPGECDTSLRPGWFYHPDQQPKSLKRLLEIYFKSVGRNCVLLLNVPPTPEGRFDQRDVERLREFGASLDAIFSRDFSAGASASASNVRGNAESFAASMVLDGDVDTYWATDDGVDTGRIQLEFDSPTTFDVIRLQEPIHMGQRVAGYHVDVLQNGEWTTVVSGTTIGHKKLDRLDTPVTTRGLRVIVDRALAEPLIAEIGLHRIPPGIADGAETSTTLFDSSTRPDIACYRIPALVTAPNGDLVAAIDERVPSCDDLRSNDDINIVIRRSNDRGDTWTVVESVVDYPTGESASDPSMIVDEITGEIFLFYNFMDHNDDPGTYYHHVVRSSDNGVSWSSPADITSQISKPEWRRDFKFITSGRGIQTSTGTLLHTLVNLDHGLHLFGSEDHGNSWHLIDTPIRPANESKIVELSDGSLLVNSRVEGNGERYSHRSWDGGRTWSSRSEPSLPDPGCNASVIIHEGSEGTGDRRLIFSNAADPVDRKNLTVRSSLDDGATWSGGRMVYAGHSAYSSMTVMDNGDIGLVFEKDGYRQNIFVRMGIEWLSADSARPSEKTD
jgi:alpha-L-fucosidase